MSIKLPPIKYKLNPKMQQIMQEKKRRREILQREKQKVIRQQQQIRKQKKQYFEMNKQMIESKKQIIYNKKLSQHNKVREQEKQRQIRIQIKKAQRLATLLPQRSFMIQQLKKQYIKFLEQKDLNKQQKIKQIFQRRIQKANQQNSQMIPLQRRIKEQNLMDINQGICILCLTSQAQIFMVECRHLISCKQCQFILRMQKKCPVCRKLGNYKNVNQKTKKKSKSSISKQNK